MSGKDDDAHHGRVRGLLLVGGRSTRMGTDKASLVGSDGQTLLQRGLDRLSSVCTSVAVSARPDQVDQLREQLPLECGIIVDRLVESGPASALLAAHAHDPSASWLAFACDFPLTPLAAFEALLAAHHAEHWATCYENEDGFVEPLFAVWTPPLLARLRQQVETGNVSPSSAIKTARKLAPDRVAVVKPREASWLLNANTPDEFAAAQARRRHSPSITLAAAQERVMRLAGKLSPLDVERVELERCVGRVVAEAVWSSMSLPPFRNSAMDGIVVRSSDCTSLPVRLRVQGTIAAGDPVLRAKVDGCICWEIMTGAPLPDDESFDAVIRNEDYAAPGKDGIVELVKLVQEGQNVRRAGEDVKRGQRLLEAGMLIRSAQIGVLSATGVTSIGVRRKLRVGVIATGSELVPKQASLASGQIYNSNGPTLAAFLSSSGHTPILLPAAPDDPTAFLATLASLPDLDALIITGGVSAGKFDFVPDALSKAGATFLFRSVAMRPGHPCHVALLHDSLPVFALPGNPLAALACYRLLVEPHLRARLGREPERPIRAKLAGDRPCRKPSAAFVVRTGVLDRYEGTVEVLHDQQGAGSVGSLSVADVFVALPVGAEVVEPGSVVDVWPL